jgi:hypothetical protein
MTNKCQYQQEHQHYCYDCSHTNGSHYGNSNCRAMVETRKEWYILGTVKLAEAMVIEPCKCLRFLPKQLAIRSSVSE